MWLKLKYISLLLIASNLTHFLDLAQAESSNSSIIDQAYKSIPHRQTQYSISASTLDSQHSLKIRELFNYTDQALYLRTKALEWLYAPKWESDAITNINKRYKDISRDISTLERSSENLNKIVLLINDAVFLHAQYFEQESKKLLKSKPTKFVFDARDQKIQEAHAKLYNAYNLLMQEFSRESEKNKQAFFDHLCALDYI